MPGKVGSGANPASREPPQPAPEGPGMDRAESSATAPVALARRLVVAGRRGDAEQVVAGLIRRKFDMAVRRASINADWTSLNSLNGIVDTEDGRCFFFKFHQEEGEEATVPGILPGGAPRAGRPAGRHARDDMPGDGASDSPLRVPPRPPARRPLPGGGRDPDAGVIAEIVGLQRDLDRLTGSIYLATLHASDAQQSSAEAVHQLFHNRLWTPPASDKLAGRVARFYASGALRLPGTEFAWDEFRRLRWRINGVDYRHNLEELFHESLRRLHPSRLGASGAVTGHGDAHNANVWVERRDGHSRLLLFDPAFAGEHMPALLADVKATFHNVFAHPLWLYHPAQADERYHVEVALEGDRLIVGHDWALTPLRQGFLAAKVELIWRPLLEALGARGWLPDDWQRVLRCALFCCPTLVMNLRADTAHGATAGRSASISALSFAIAVMAGSEPESGGPDPFAQFLAAIAPARAA